MSDERGASAVHEAGHLSYDVTTYARDAAWPKMPKYLREQLTELVGGQIVEWWANGSPRGPSVAVVLGPAGLCHAEPVTGPDGKPGHRLRTARFAPRSLWTLASGTPVSLPASSSPGLRRRSGVGHHLLPGDRHRADPAAGRRAACRARSRGPAAELAHRAQVLPRQYATVN